MNIIVKKEKEFIKNIINFRVKLYCNIKVIFSDEEKKLINKYNDPKIEISNIRKSFKGSDEEFIIVKHSINNPHISAFDITAYVNDGYQALGNLIEFENAVLETLENSFMILKLLEDWDKENIIELND